MTDDRLAAHHLETVLGQTIDLIPYEREHVPMFNRWLQDPEMQQLVATPAVTVDADYSFQEECAHSTDSIYLVLFPGEGRAYFNASLRRNDKVDPTERAWTGYWGC